MRRPLPDRPAPHRRTAALALGALLALAGTVAPPLAAPASAADDTASIAHLEPSDAGLQVLVSLPPGADPDLGGVSAQIDGQDAGATAEPAGTSAAVSRTAVLVLDVSRSMQGARFEAATAAARTFLDTVPDDVQVGLVTFADGVSVDQAPTTDHAAVASALDGLTLSRRTSLYAGVAEAVRAAGDEGQRSLLVLSDGADTTDTPITEAVTAITDADVTVDVIALDQSASATGLSELAAAGGGTVIPATRAALSSTFADEAEVLARQVLVTIDVPEDAAGEATVSVTVPTSGGDLSAEAFGQVLPDGASPATTPSVAPVDQTPPSGLPSWALYAGSAVLLAGLVLLLVLLVPAPRPDLTPAERVTSYTERVGAAPSESITPEAALAQAREAAATLLKRNRGLEERVAARLEAAGSELKPAEWLLVHAGVLVSAGLVGVLLGGGKPIVGLLFLVVGALGPWMYLGVRRSRRRKAFNTMLPETLQLMSGSLAAGLSLAQSVDTITREGTEPMTSAFRRVLAETRLGVSLEEALDGVAERFDSKDFEWVVMAIRIQRQVGGNLAELLDTVAATMREREYMRRQVNALAAEGKLSAIVLGALPPLFTFYLFLTQREYVAPMFTDPRGLVMLGFGVLWLGIGVFWMSRMVKVEV